MSDPAPGAAVGHARRRREARERALELAYEGDQRGLVLDELLATLPRPPDDFTVVLLRAAESRRSEADRLVAERLRGWSHDRLPVVDRLVLRLAVAELLAVDTPTGVIIAEGVDLAGRYGTDESSRFVNGVLSAVAAEVRPTDGVGPS